MRLLALVTALSLASGPAAAAWSGECAAPSPDPQLSEALGPIDAAADLAKAGGGAPPPAPGPAPTPTPFPVPVTLSVKLKGARIVSGTEFLQVAHYEQIGSTCGYYAAKMVLDRWETLHGRPAPRAVDLYDIAVEDGASKSGYVGTDRLAQAIEAFGFDTTVKKQATFEDLEKSIQDGVPPIVQFVVNNVRGEPGFGDPSAVDDPVAGHFAVIEAIYTDARGQKWIVAKHGWAEAKNSVVWPAEQFEKSWSLRNREMLRIEQP